MLRESDAAEVLPELGPDPADLIVPRTRGASVFTGTELNQTLRNVGAKAIVLVGISLNIAIMTATTEGVSCGYEVIVPEDAVLGFPYDYGEAMLTHSIRVMATLTKTDTLVDRWGSETPGEKVKQW
jgi:nicotinamidase-related amidase